MQQNLKRNIALTFRVSEEERDFIRYKMIKAGITSQRHYLLKMAVLGEIKTVDMSEVQECSRLLRSVSNNVNQIAKRVNEGGNIYATDIDDIKERLGRVWQQQDIIIKTLTKIVEAA